MGELLRKRLRCERSAVRLRSGFERSIVLKKMRAGRLALVAVILIISTRVAFCANLDCMTLSDKLVSHCRRMVGGG